MVVGGVGFPRRFSLLRFSHIYLADNLRFRAKNEFQVKYVQFSKDLVFGEFRSTYYFENALILEWYICK